MVSIPATLLRFKDLKAVSNSSVKSDSLMASLKYIKIFQAKSQRRCREGAEMTDN